jgi:hypothetical protein
MTHPAMPRRQASMKSRHPPDKSAQFSANTIEKAEIFCSRPAAV